MEAREIICLLRDITGRDSFVKKLVDSCGDAEKPIGVICMYAEQKRVLQRLLSEQDWASGFRNLVKIDTVDSYQGKQNRMIILSTTRNNESYDQGHVRIAERINVSVSRAMDSLVIVGAARMWRDRNGDSPLGRVLSYVQTNSDGRRFGIVPVQPARNPKRGRNEQ